MRRNIITSLVRIFLFVTTLFFFGAYGCSCKGKEKENEKPFDVEIVGEKSIVLCLEEEYELKLKKTYSDGEEGTIEQVVYESEAPLIASISQTGKIVGQMQGKTYINITADGQETALFVEVLSSKKGVSAELYLSDTTLYKGFSTRGEIILYENGSEVNVPLEITWSSDNEAKASVSEDGLIMANSDEGQVTIKAQFTYKDVQYTVEKKLNLTKISYLSLSATQVRLAAEQTVTGKANDKFVNATISAYFVDALTEEKIQLGKENMSVASSDESIASVAVNNEGIITVRAFKTGVARITVEGHGKKTYATVNVFNPIAEIADMDALSIACLNNADLLKGQYMLVNDIDYNGEIIYPIASFKESNNSRSAGIIWQYLLEKTNGEYALKERSEVSAEKGLTDAEFSALSQSNGINPKNLSFSGIMDGNGFSIKNAKITYGSYIVDNPTKNMYYSAHSSIFGYVTGTLENIAFENISEQSPANAAYNLNRVCSIGGNRQSFAENALTLKDGAYARYGCGVVGHSSGGTFKNVFVSIDYSLKSSSTDDAALCVSGTGLKVNNCVLVVASSVNKNNYAIRSQDSTWGVENNKNNLCFGVKLADLGYNKKDNAGLSLNGENGNWWTQETNANSIFNQEKGSDCSNAVALLSVIESFDSNIWNMQSFKNEINEYPYLIDGCSVYK